MHSTLKLTYIVSDSFYTKISVEMFHGSPSEIYLEIPPEISLRISSENLLGFHRDFSRDYFQISLWKSIKKFLSGGVFFIFFSRNSFRAPLGVPSEIFEKLFQKIPHGLTPLRILSAIFFEIFTKGSREPCRFWNSV